jgi:hypothetical protein
LFVILVIALSVLLRYTNSDYPFGIFKLFLLIANSLKDKAKVKPAPIVEAGYSLYSAASENSVTGDLDTCSEVLARLKERRKGR